MAFSSCSIDEEDRAGRLKSTVALVLSKKDFNLRSARCDRLQEFGKLLLSCLSKAKNSAAVICFAKKLDTLFDRALGEVVAEKSLSTQREKKLSSPSLLRNSRSLETFPV